uniref:Serine/threonine-protein kinase Nek1 isoform X1 n=1 Tax=Rhizophora mucronata TaxID=61149 RepID=A0A2P2MBB3_RHIMU
MTWLDNKISHQRTLKFRGLSLTKYLVPYFQVPMQNKIGMQIFNSQQQLCKPLAELLHNFFNS